ncbi:MAG: RDD family protein [Nocardioides sp.]|nr:RDD family protein [Nocardioides sp.]
MTQISADSTTRLTIASFGVRFAAYAIDSVCAFVLQILVVLALMIAHSTLESMFSVAMMLLWYALFWRFAHGTPGKLALSLRIEPWAGPGRLSWWSVLRRYLTQFGIPILITSPFAFSHATGDELETVMLGLLVTVFLAFCWTMLDCLWSLGNPAHQTLHDKAAGTVVVRETR